AAFSLEYPLPLVVLRYTLYPETVDVLAFQLSATECDCGATPVPDSAMLAGEPAALLTTETLPLAVPAAEGLNCTANVSVCVGDNFTGVPAPLKVYPEPLILICEIVTLAFPVLVMVTLCWAELPVFTLPKLKLLELRETAAVAATPVPVKGTVAGELGALLTSETPPETLPADCGTNCTLNVLEDPGLRESGSPTELVEKPLPVTLNCEIVSSAVPLLEI